MQKTSGALLIACCMISGCQQRYYHWGTGQFSQVVQRDPACAQIGCYIRSFDRYDEFATVGLFDILWYTRAVFDWQCGQLLRKLGGVQTEAYTSFVEKGSSEDEQYYIFYLLLSDDTSGSLRPLLSVEQGDCARWAATLVVGCNDPIAPCKIQKLLELCPELALCFGKRYEPRYRAIFKLSFPRSTAEAPSECIKLFLRSATYEVVGEWPVVPCPAPEDAE